LEIEKHLILSETKLLTVRCQLFDIFQKIDDFQQKIFYKNNE